MPIIGVYGGTFNPIHHGHLALAHSALHSLHCAQIRFIPAAVPPHKRTPQVSAHHRAEMVKRAIAHQPAFVLDTCELARPGPSYTIDTLRTLKRQFPAAALCLIIGQDSYQHIRAWHAWQQLTDEAHLLIVSRAGLSSPLALLPVHQAHEIPLADAASQFATHAHGLVTVISTPPPQVSSTQLRTLLSTRAINATAPMLPASVLHYIVAHQLYLGDASSESS